MWGHWLVNVTFHFGWQIINYRQVKTAPKALTNLSWDEFCCKYSTQHDQVSPSNFHLLSSLCIPKYIGIHDDTCISHNTQSSVVLLLRASSGLLACDDPSLVCLKATAAESGSLRQQSSETRPRDLWAAALAALARGIWFECADLTHREKFSCSESVCSKRNSSTWITWEKVLGCFSIQGIRGSFPKSRASDGAATS